MGTLGQGVGGVDPPSSYPPSLVSLPATSLESLLTPLVSWFRREVSVSPTRITLGCRRPLGPLTPLRWENLETPAPEGQWRYFDPNTE